MAYSQRSIWNKKKWSFSKCNQLEIFCCCFNVINWDTWPIVSWSWCFVVYWSLSILRSSNQWIIKFHRYCLFLIFPWMLLIFTIAKGSSSFTLMNKLIAAPSDTNPILKLKLEDRVQNSSISSLLLGSNNWKRAFSATLDHAPPNWCLYLMIKPANYDLKDLRFHRL